MIPNLNELYLAQTEVVNSHTKAAFAEVYGHFQKDPETGDLVWVDPRQCELFQLTSTEKPKKSLDRSAQK